MVLDLESAVEPAREVWNPGTYEGTIVSVEPAVSQAKGNPMLTWTIEITHPHSGQTRNVRFYTVLVGDGAGRTKKTIKKVAPDLDLSQFRPNDADDLLSGLACRVVLKIGRYQGEKNNNVTDVLPALGEGYAPGR
jgi:hypothetical protein